MPVSWLSVEANKVWAWKRTISIVWGGHSYICFGTFTYMVWNKFGIYCASAFLARGVSKRSHCAVMVKNHSISNICIGTGMRAYTYIDSHTCMQREKKRCNEWSKEEKKSYFMEKGQDWKVNLGVNFYFHFHHLQSFLHGHRKL